MSYLSYSLSSLSMALVSTLVLAAMIFAFDVGLFHHQQISSFGEPINPAKFSGNERGSSIEI